MDLRGTAVNKKLSFAELSAGEHILAITAEDSTGREAVEVVRCTFYMEETPKPTEPEVTEPTQPQPTETQPEVTQPTETEPEVTQPAPTQPEVTAPTTAPTLPPITEPLQPQDTPEELTILWIAGVILGLVLIAGIGILLIPKHKEKAKQEQ